MPEVSDLRSRLRRIAPEDARRRNVLLALLNGAPSPLGRVGAAIDETLARAPALVFTCGVAATPVTVDGAPATWVDAGASSTLPEALVDLGRLEPLLAEAERRLGVALDPSSLGSPPAGGLRLRLAIADDDGGERHVLSLDVPASLRPPPLRPRALRDLEHLGGARVRLRLEARGRPAPLRELVELAVGDLVLADGDARSLDARLAAPGDFAIVGRWRPQDGRFALGGPMSDEAADVRAEPAGSAPPDIRVRLGFNLGEAEVTLADLAALAPGAVLAAPLAGDAPRVEVTAGGAHIATGRLVALGEAYGVLIDEVRGAPPAAGEGGA